MVKPFRLSLTALLAGLALLTIACGDDDDEATPTATAAPSQGTTLDVALSDFKIEMDSSSGPAGSYTFNLSNAGPEQHEFVVFKTDLAADKLPVEQSKVNEDAPGLQLIDEQEEFPKGETRVLTLDLEPGKYVFICNVATHYEQGMRFAFTVS